MEPARVKMFRSAELPILKIPKPAIPVTIRRAHMDDAVRITELCGQAYTNETWTQSSTEAELFQDHTVKAVLVATLGDRLVSTASLQLKGENKQSGQIRWVATEQTMRRQGLAKILVARILKIAVAEGCSETFLYTTTDAPGAIRLYLQLGFNPKVDTDLDREIWIELRQLLGTHIPFQI